MKPLISSALVILTLFLSACSPETPSENVFSEDDIKEFKEFHITAHQFAFEPEIIEVQSGDKVRLVITSKDVAHGFALPEYGINVRIDPGETEIVEFVADKEGTFTIVCSVFCGADHGEMNAQLIVK